MNLFYLLLLAAVISFTYAYGYSRGYQIGHVAGYWSDRHLEHAYDVISIESLRPANGELDTEALIETIRAEVFPTSWAGNGGTARILQEQYGGELYIGVHHTPEAISQIKELIARLPR